MALERTSNSSVECPRLGRHPTLVKHVPGDTLPYRVQCPGGQLQGGSCDTMTTVLLNRIITHAHYNEPRLKSWAE